MKIEFPTKIYGDLDNYFPTETPKSNGADPRANLPPVETAIPVQKPIKWLDMSKWDDAPVPARKWAIRDRVPLNQA